MEYFLRDSLWGTAACFYLGNRVSVARELSALGQRRSNPPTWGRSIVLTNVVNM